MLLICGLAWYFLWRPFPVDSAIPHYTKVDNLNGNLVSVGSDTLADVMVLGSQQFQKLYPNVTMHLEPIKALGTFSIPVKLLTDVTATLKLEVVKADKK